MKDLTSLDLTGEVKVIFLSFSIYLKFIFERFDGSTEVYRFTWGCVKGDKVADTVLALEFY